jgi:putative endonuclease
MYQVYFLMNPQGRRYIGLSEDVPNRVEQHNLGISKWTAKYRPWSLQWTSRLMSLGDARRLESKMKRQKGGSGLLRLMNAFSGEPGGALSPIVVDRNAASLFLLSSPLNEVVQLEWTNIT